MSILAVEGAISKVKYIAGDTHLGGKTFGNEMVSPFVAEFKYNNKKDISGKKRTVCHLPNAWEKVKRTFSSITQTSTEIDSLY